MPRPKMPKSVLKRRSQSSENLSERLKLPVLDPSKLHRLRSSKRRSRTIAELVDELETFSAVGDAIKRSHRYYVAALHKAYEAWIDLLDVNEQQRNEVIKHLDMRNTQPTKRGDAIHVLLRALIDYEAADPNHSRDEAKKARQSAAARLSRDAAVLAHAQRNDVKIDEFVAMVRSTAGGLDQIAKSEAKARRAERGVESRMAARRPVDEPSVQLGPPVRERPQPAEPQRPRWKVGRALRRKLASRTLVNRELLVRVFVAEDGSRVVRDVYQPTTRVFDDDAFAKDMEGIEARLVGHGHKRPRV